MQLAHCLVSSDANPRYLKFFPLVRQAWQNVLGIPVTLALVGHELPDDVAAFRDEILLFEPIEEVHPTFQAQVLRLLVPGNLLGASGAVITSDIDMLPISPEYFWFSVSHLPDHAFASYRPVLHEAQLAVCYCAASSATWRALFGGHNLTSLRHQITAWWRQYGGGFDGRPGCPGWSTDQRLLYQAATAFEHFHALTDTETGFHRLDRVDSFFRKRMAPSEVDSMVGRLSLTLRNRVFNPPDPNKTEKQISDLKRQVYERQFTDFHMPRPYESHRHVIDEVAAPVLRERYTPPKDWYEDRNLVGPEYGTHVIPLLKAVLATTGPVLELGCGDFSTPLLHEVLAGQGRFLLSCDTNRAWLGRFRNLASELHEFLYVPVYGQDENRALHPESWDRVGTSRQWGVVLVDHRPGERRRVDIERLAHLAEILVVHDTEWPGYEYETVFAKFPFRWDARAYRPWTTLVSHRADVTKLDDSEQPPATI